MGFLDLKKTWIKLLKMLRYFKAMETTRKMSIELTPLEALSILAVSDVIFKKYQITNKDITDVFNVLRQEIINKITGEDLDDVEAHLVTRDFLKSINL